MARAICANCIHYKLDDTKSECTQSIASINYVNGHVVYGKCQDINCHGDCEKYFSKDALVMLKIVFALTAVLIVLTFAIIIFSNC